jgi:hypothetical protein
VTRNVPTEQEIELRFVKGQSGNPGRAKALIQIQEAARAYTVTAVATLARICGDETAPHAAQVAAANALLDRGWGRPRQPIDAKVEMTLEDLVAASMRPRVIEGGHGGNVA